MSQARALLSILQESHGYGFDTMSNPLATTADSGQVAGVEEDVEIEEVIRHVGSKWILKSKSTGRVLGTHHSKADALAQERAIKASQARAGK